LLSERLFNFEANKIGWVVEPSTTLIGSIGPVVSDEHKNDVALGESVFNSGPKVSARHNGVDVFEHASVTVSRHQPIEDAACDLGGIGAAI